MNHVYCEDSLEAMKTFPDKYFDLCLTDPPYGVGLKYNGYNDTRDNWIDLMNKFIPLAKRVSKMLIMPSCRIAELPWIYANHSPDWLISWYKGSPGHRSFIGFNDWEPHLVYGKTSSQMQMHDFFQSRLDEQKGNYDHPCPKPLHWAKWLISRALPCGGRVLDAFGGSMTTVIACMQMGFDYMAFEIDQDYFKAAKKRIENELSQTDLFIEKRRPEFKQTSFIE